MNDGSDIFFAGYLMAVLTGLAVLWSFLKWLLPAVFKLVSGWFLDRL